MLVASFDPDCRADFFSRRSELLERDLEDRLFDRDLLFLLKLLLLNLESKMELNFDVLPIVSVITTFTISRLGPGLRPGTSPSTTISAPAATPTA